jgi:hypothetical protein
MKAQVIQTQLLAGEVTAHAPNLIKKYSNSKDEENVKMYRETIQDKEMKQE